MVVKLFLDLFDRFFSPFRPTFFAFSKLLSSNKTKFYHNIMKLVGSKIGWQLCFPPLIVVIIGSP